MADYVYSETELVCQSCGDWTHYVDGNAETVVCDGCTDGQPLSALGKEVTRETARGGV